MTVPTARRVGDRYVLEQLLATGGMGEVWQGRDTVLERAVAVKVPRSGLAHDPDFLDRFHSEARHAALLTHPNIASVFDFGAGEDSPYLVMELVGGEPLSKIINRDAPLDPDWVRGVLSQVAAALACAHEAGLIHRDIKPANLLVCPDGTVKVTDFGIARAVGAAGTTQVGMVTGTAPYLSPEQLAGEPATPAGDLYALGVVAYECLAGRRPFDGDPAVIWWAHRDDAPLPPLPRTVPPDLAALVAALLSRRPEARPSAADLGRLAPAAAAEAGPGPTRVFEVPVTDQAPVRDAARPLSVAPRPAAALPRPVPRAPNARWWLWPTLAAAGLVLVLAVIALTGGGAGQRAPAAPGKAPTGPDPYRVVDVALFHPGGSGEDYPGDARLAADGNPATAWHTQHYATATFGALRPGVGLIFDLGSPVPVGQIRLTLIGPGAGVAVHAGNDAGGLLQSTPVAASGSAPADFLVTPSSPQRARYWLVWFDHLPPGGPFQAGIAEAAFRR